MAQVKQKKDTTAVLWVMGIWSSSDIMKSRFLILNLVHYQELKKSVIRQKFFSKVCP